MVPYLSKFLEWLNQQPEGTQGLVFVAVVIGLSLAGRAVEWVAVLVWKTAKREFEAWRRGRQPIAAEPTKVGLYDHAINAADAIARMPRAMTSAAECSDRIVAKLTKHADVVSAEPDIRKRRALIAAFGQDLRPEVLRYSKIARAMSDDSALIVSSHRSVFNKVNVNTLNERVALLEERHKFLTMGRAFPTTITVIDSYRKKITGLTDIVPDLGQKYETGLALVSESFRSLHAFSTKEAPSIINKRVGRTARIVFAIRRIASSAPRTASPPPSQGA